MLSSVEVDQVQPVLCGDQVLLELLVNDLPSLDKISTGAEGDILLAAIDTSDEKEVDAIVTAAFAEEGCKRVDHCIVNTIEESGSVQQKLCFSPTRFLYQCRLPEQS